MMFRVGTFFEYLDHICLYYNNEDIYIKFLDVHFIFAYSQLVTKIFCKFKKGKRSKVIHLILRLKFLLCNNAMHIYWVCYTK